MALSFRRHGPARPACTRLVELMHSASGTASTSGGPTTRTCSGRSRSPLTLAIQATSTMKFGHLVTNPGTRDPTVLASLYATMHDISERPHGDGHRPRRLRPPLHRPAARAGRRVRGRPADDQAVHERRGGSLERHRTSSSNGCGPSSRGSRCGSPATARRRSRSPDASATGSSSSSPTRRSSSGSWARRVPPPRRRAATRRPSSASLRSEPRRRRHRGRA